MPRSLVHGGLRGPGQDVFPESAIETARHVGYEEGSVVILKKNVTDDGAGSNKTEWIPQPAKRGYIEAISGNSSTTQAEQVTEGTTHVIYVDPDVDVTTAD